MRRYETKHTDINGEREEGRETKTERQTDRLTLYDFYLSAWKVERFLCEDGLRLIHRYESPSVLIIFFEAQTKSALSKDRRTKQYDPLFPVPTIVFMS